MLQFSSLFSSPLTAREQQYSLLASWYTNSIRNWSAIRFRMSHRTKESDECHFLHRSVRQWIFFYDFHTGISWLFNLSPALVVTFCGINIATLHYAIGVNPSNVDTIFYWLSFVIAKVGLLIFNFMYVLYITVLLYRLRIVCKTIEWELVWFSAFCVCCIFLSFLIYIDGWLNCQRVALQSHWRRWM